MAASNPPDAEIAALLRRRPRIALVGASDKPERASFRVMRFLLDHGFEVVPVNPVLAGRSIHGRRVVASLAEAAPLDMVDVFRRSEEAGAVIEEAVALGAQAVWLQLGVMAEEAAARARSRGVMVVQDRCPAIEWPRLGLDG
ncbi:MAG: CoA-binding protein [Rhodovarius sp.]|nr:CoA-binding protein [Rhodovarius sp.]MDW8315737.1 CoA-binding protein [Rhodovarius sp.]